MGLDVEQQRNKVRLIKKNESVVLKKSSRIAQARKRLKEKSALRLAVRRADDLINKATKPEKALMKQIDLGGILSYKFQSIIMRGETFFIVDFLFGTLIVEIDGEYHYTSKGIKKDYWRTSTLKKWGYDLIRFTNKESLNNSYGVMKAISDHISGMQE